MMPVMGQAVLSPKAAMVLFDYDLVRHLIVGMRNQMKAAGNEDGYVVMDRLEKLVEGERNRWYAGEAARIQVVPAGTVPV